MTTYTIGNVGQISKAKIRHEEIKKEPIQERLEDKIISCRITPFTSDPDENLHIFLRSNNIKYYVSDEMSPLWPYGRVIITSAGFNGEFYRNDDGFMSLMFLGKEKDEALKLMSRLVEQNIEIDKKKKFF